MDAFLPRVTGQDLWHPLLQQAAGAAAFVAPTVPLFDEDADAWLELHKRLLSASVAVNGRVEKLLVYVRLLIRIRDLGLPVIAGRVGSFRLVRLQTTLPRRH